MKQYNTNHIRNLALLGHNGSGKTSLTEAMNYITGVVKRPGKIEDGNTISDYSEEEKKRQISINLSVLPVEWKDYKINLLDTPGYFDFAGQVYASLRAAEAGLMVIDADNGIEVGSEIYWNYMEKISLPRIIFVNKMDKENVDFSTVVSDLHQQFGQKVIPLTYPIGEGENFEGLVDIVEKKAYKYDGFKSEEIEIPEDMVDEVNVVYNELVEVIAMTDDALMEKFFNDEPFTDQEIREGMITAVLEGSAVPLIAGSAVTGAGIDLLLDCVCKYMPAPDDERANPGFRPEEGDPLPMKADQPMSMVVVKTIVDPYVGRITIVKVTSGTYKKGEEFYNASKKLVEKPNGPYYIRGKETMDCDQLVAGDIGAFTKLEHTESGDSISTEDHPIIYKRIKLPDSNLSFAIAADSKNDEDKMSSSLKKLAQEDLTFKLDRNVETNQLLIKGLGNVQLEAAMEKLASVYGVNVHKEDLIIPYRETIRGKAQVEGRHKKQTGGAGQFADVFIRFEPIEEGFEFDEEVFGGAVPKNFFPAVEKGLEECLSAGPLAGYPVIGLKATLYDGSYHPVDSNEMAFKTAAKLAFKKGMAKADPILLEPVMTLKVTIPDDYLGDVMGDLNKRRGRILGMDQVEGKQVVNAEAPLAEVAEYAIDLRSMTQGRGQFSMEFKDYEPVPADLSEKIIESRKGDEEE